MKNKYLLLFLCLFLSINAAAQEPLLYSRPSQMAKVFQRIGTTDLEIVYHAPHANGREVFGEVVIYNEKLHGKPQPWRAGANENTLIKFGHDVQINGKDLAAGEYGLHIFVSESSWTLAFSNYSKGWGSFAYKAEEDALKVALTPQKAPYQDWLSYQFTNPRSYAATIELRWADQMIAFEVSTNVHANIIADVNGMKDKTWQALLTAANSVLELNPNDLDKAMALIDQSLLLEAHFNNRMMKVELLMKQGKNKEADELKAEAIDKADAVALFGHAMNLNNKGEEKEALRILKMNQRRHPKHWYVHLGFGHYYRGQNDKRAVDHMKKAWEMAPERAKPFANYQYGFAKSKFGQ